LAADFELGERRVLEKGIEYELNEGVLIHLWERLEDWRIETAASLEAKKDNSNVFKTYVSIAEAISSEHEQLKILLEVELEKEISTTQHEAIADMLATVEKTEQDSDKIALLVMMILQGRLKRDSNGQKHVVFCSNKTAVDKINERLSNVMSKNFFQVLDAEMNDDDLAFDSRRYTEIANPYQ